MALQDDIFKFFEVWGAKLGDSALKAVNDAVGYKNQTVDLEIDNNASGVSFKGGVTTYTLAFKQDYWRYIESGVNGTKNSQGSPYSFKSGGGRIPVKPLEGWIAKRGIRVQVKQGIKGKSKGLAIDKARKGLAFAMSTEIKKHGLKPRPFIDNIVTPELDQELTDGMTKILKQEVITSFTTFD